MSAWSLRVAVTPDEQQRTFAVRSIVFIGEQHCPYGEEFDGLDHECIHVLGEEAGEPIAAARLRPVNGVAKLERIAVVQPARGRGIGGALVEYLLELARARGFHRFKMHAQLHLVDFYRRYGFVPQGEVFQEAGIDHLVMVREEPPPIGGSGGPPDASAAGIPPASLMHASITGMPYTTTMSVPPVAAVSAPAVVYGGFWIRLAASLIDTAISLLLTWPIMYLWYGQIFTEDLVAGGMDILLNWILPPILTVFFWYRFGATPGKMLCGLRIVDARTGGQPSVGRLILRYVGYFLAILPLGVGILWLVGDPRKQGWHDKLAETVVVKRRPGERLRFETQLRPGASAAAAADQRAEDWMPF